MKIYGDWGLGIGDWGFGIGDWAQSPIPNPQSPIPITRFNKLKILLFKKIIFKLIKFIKIINLININKYFNDFIIL